MKTEYNTPELQEAFDSGRELGRVEGMIRHLQIFGERLKKDHEKLLEKYKRMKSE